MANQYDPTVIKSGIPTVLGTDTLRADLNSHAGLTTTGLADGDAVQITAALTLSKAVNTSTSAVAGIYDDVSGSIVRAGVVVATFKSGVTLANGDTVYLSSTPGQLTNVKPTTDVIHEVGVVVHAGDNKILLQQKPVIVLPATYIWSSVNLGVSKFLASDGSFIGKYNATASSRPSSICYDGTYIWIDYLLNGDANLGRRYKFNAATGALVGGPYTVLGWVCGGLSFDGTNYWHGNSHATNDGGPWLRKSNASGVVLSTHSMSPYKPQSICYDGVGNIWSLSQYSSYDYYVNKVNLSGTILLSDDTTQDMYTQPQGSTQVCSDKTYVYVAMGHDYDLEFFVYRYNISTNARTIWGPYSSLRYPNGICTDGNGYLWVLGWHAGTTQNRLSKIRVSDGAEVATYDLGVIGGSAGGKVCHDGSGYIWASRTYSNNIRKLRASDGATIGDYGNGTNSPTADNLCSTFAVLPYP